MFCFNVVIIEMRGQYGYLSAIEWPLLPVSCCNVPLISYLFHHFIYTFYGIVFVLHDCVGITTF